jgi:pimeloyl-ACP methyl ester carboxylesterase
MVSEHRGHHQVLSRARSTEQGLARPRIWRLNGPVIEKPSILLLHGVQSSQLTWWRLRQDLLDLGWQVDAVDLLGHGSRNAAGPDNLTIADLTRDVLDQRPGPVDVLAGHSLGSIVALSVAALAPAYCNRVLIEDPPGLAGSLDLGDVAADVEASVRLARDDSAGTVTALLEENPVWSRRDAENSVQNRLSLDLVRVTRLLRTTRWDLQALVRDCPVPVQLLAATRDSALTDPDRSVIMSRLPTEHVAVIESGHTIHRERPGLWLHHVLRFAEPT